MKPNLETPCAECGRPAQKHEFARDWCLDCLGVVEKELDALEREAQQVAPAINEEFARLAQIHKHEFRGHPAEL